MIQTGVQWDRDATGVTATVRLNDSDWPRFSRSDLRRISRLGRGCASAKLLALVAVFERIEQQRLSVFAGHEESLGDFEQPAVT